MGDPLHLVVTPSILTVAGSTPGWAKKNGVARLTHRQSMWRVSGRTSLKTRQPRRLDAGGRWETSWEYCGRRGQRRVGYIRGMVHIENLYK